MIEYTEGESFPNKERILHAYLSFEGLTDHDYLYACVSCGYHPAVVVMDLHKKGVFSMPGKYLAFRSVVMLILLKKMFKSSEMKIYKNI